MASAELDVSGSSATAPLTLRVPARQRRAKIFRVNILGPASSTCSLYVGSTDATQWRDGSSSGAQDVAEYPNGLNWPSGMALILRWDKAGSASAHIEYDDGT